MPLSHCVSFSINYVFQHFVGIQIYYKTSILPTYLRMLSFLKMTKKHHSDNKRIEKCVMKIARLNACMTTIILELERQSVVRQDCNRIKPSERAIT